MQQKETSRCLSVLMAGVAVPDECLATSIQVWSANDGRGVLAQLRTLRVDLLLLGRELPDTSALGLMRRVRVVHPQQKWALVAQRLARDEEIEARALGVMALFDLMPPPEQLMAIVEKLYPQSPGPPVISVAEPHRPRPPGSMKVRSPTGP